jgi:hypothetical protein
VLKKEIFNRAGDARLNDILPAWSAQTQAGADFALDFLATVHGHGADLAED